MRNDDRPMKNPSYDKSLLPEVRFADFLGAYCIRLNSFNTPPSSQEAKQAIVEFVTKDLFDDTQLDDIDRLLAALKQIVEQGELMIENTNDRKRGEAAILGCDEAIATAGVINQIAREVLTKED